MTNPPPREESRYSIARELGTDFIYRFESVDLENLRWMTKSPFITSLVDLGINQDDTIMDFGSHIGSWSLPLVKRFGCRCFCFEPDEASLLISRASATLNKLEGLITFIQAGIGGKDGKFILYESNETWGHTMIEGGGPYNLLTGHSTEIEVLSLDSALNLACTEGRIIVKVNIEGAEYEMFEGSSPKTLEKVDFWIGEIHYDLGRTDFAPCVAKLREAGFSVTMIHDGESRDSLIASKA